MTPPNSQPETPRATGESLTDWRLRALEKTVETLETEIAGLRKVLLGFAISVSVSSIVFALSVANLTG